MSTHNVCFQCNKIVKKIPKIIFLSMVVSYPSIETTGNFAKTSKRIFLDLRLAFGVKKNQKTTFLKYL